MAKKLLILLITLGLNFSAMAQAISDAGLWNTIKVNKKINKKLSLFLTEEYRVKENISQTNLLFTELGVVIKPLKFLKTSASYRFTEKYMKNKTFTYRHRFVINLTFKQKFGNVSLSYRQRIQTEYSSIYTSETGNIPAWYYRHKVGIKYKLDKPLTPYIAAEIRYQIYDHSAQESNMLFDRNRYVAGVDYKLNKKNSIGLYYLFQNNYNTSTRKKTYIIGIEYTLSLK